MKGNLAFGSSSPEPSWLRTLLLVAGLAVFTALLTNCGGGTAGPSPPRQLVSVIVQPNSTTAIRGDTVPFSATGTFNQAPLTQANLPAQWTSSDAKIATIDPNTGAATCVAVGGPITISASAAGKGGVVNGSASLHCDIPPYPVATINEGAPLVDCYILPDHDLSNLCVCTAKKATLTNTGGAPLNIGSITPPSVPFSEQHDCPWSLQTGQSCTITIGFSPRSFGYFVGHVSIADDALDSPQRVQLFGEATSCHV
jgi:Bacterial Ig-like domain (group 2)